MGVIRDTAREHLSRARPGTSQLRFHVSTGVAIIFRGYAVVVLLAAALLTPANAVLRQLVLEGRGPSRDAAATDHRHAAAAAGRSVAAPFKIYYYYYYCWTGNDND